MKIDLHLHSTYSDGSKTPQEIVAIAKENCLDKIAITDHDTISGVEIAMQEAKKVGIQCISGVEISSYSTTEIHILGYNFDLQNQQLNQSLSFFEQKRKERVVVICEKLLKYNINLDIAELLKNKSVGRLHIAQMLVNGGHVCCVPEAFDRYLGAKGLVYCPSKRISPANAVKIINDAEGLAVIAHPLRFLQQAKLEDLIIGLLPYGLSGLEVYYPTHSLEVVQKLNELANKYGLIATGGSDFHGDYRNVSIGEVQYVPTKYMLNKLGFDIKQ